MQVVSSHTCLGLALDAISTELIVQRVYFLLIQTPIGAKFDLPALASIENEGTSLCCTWVRSGSTPQTCKERIK